jgi:integrase
MGIGGTGARRGGGAIACMVCALAAAVALLLLGLGALAFPSTARAAASDPILDTMAAWRRATGPKGRKAVGSARRSRRLLPPLRHCPGRRTGHAGRCGPATAALEPRRATATGVQRTMPDALDRKYPNAPTDWRWQWVFPQASVTERPDRPAGSPSHRRGAGPIAGADAVTRAGLAKRASCHTFRHSFATHLLGASTTSGSSRSGWGIAT